MADSTTEASDFQGTYSHSAQAAPRQLSSGDFKDLAARADAANGTLDAVRADCPFIRVQIRVTGAVDCQLCWAASDAGDADFSHWLTIPSGTSSKIAAPRSGPMQLSIRCNGAVDLVADFEAW